MPSSHTGSSADFLRRSRVKTDLGVGEMKHLMSEAVRRRYQKGEGDEELSPLVRADAQGKPIYRIQPGEVVIFYDLRGEREVELSRALTELDFPYFPIAGPVQLYTMIEYHPSLNARVAFPPEERLKNTLCEVLSSAGISILKISESEKAIHLGYFLNGKRVEPFPGEERMVIPSPQVDDYSKVPELSAQQVAEKSLELISNPAYKFIVINFANVDVVGHLENESAILKAVEVVDRQMARVVEKALSLGITCLITADHGTVEKWLYPDGAIDTGHTSSPVPLILADVRLKGKKLSLPEGELIDLAPTILSLFNLPLPREMSGKNLLKDFPLRSERVLLLILDGWGWREEEYGNLILKANTSNFDRLWQDFPHTILKASGLSVGMPEGTVGNSEAGHLHIGAGRKIYSDRLRIDLAIEKGDFFKNPVFLEAIQLSREKKLPLHLLGIVSFYSSHGSLEHLFALLDLSRKEELEQVYLHCLLGRRGERPESGAYYIAQLEDYCSRLGLGRVATVMGRFWALDREERWERVERAYRALVFGEGILVKP